MSKTSIYSLMREFISFKLNKSTKNVCWHIQWSL